MNKAYFFPRLIAYLIDILIITMIASMIGRFIPTGNALELEQEFTIVQEKFQQGEIELEACVRQIALISHDLDYALVPVFIVEITLLILYFVLFQFYQKGQTLGKRLMKLRVVSSEEGRELTMNDYLYRSFISNALLVNILLIILVLFMNREVYFYINISLQIFQFILLLVIIFMMLFRRDGRGLHDLVAHSKVIMID